MRGKLNLPFFLCVKMRGKWNKYSAYRKVSYGTYNHFFTREITKWHKFQTKQKQKSSSSNKFLYKNVWAAPYHVQTQTDHITNKKTSFKGISYHENKYFLSMWWVKHEEKNKTLNLSMTRVKRIHIKVTFITTKVSRDYSWYITFSK